MQILHGRPNQGSKFTVLSQYSVAIKRQGAWGEHLIAEVWSQSYIRNMNSQNFSHEPKQQAVNTQQSTSAPALKQAKTNFQPTPDAVAKKAYFSYLNGGSQPGQEVKHWLEAEAQLFAGIDREMKILPR